jgi:hypothetical protein
MCFCRGIQVGNLVGARELEPPPTKLLQSDPNTCWREAMSLAGRRGGRPCTRGSTIEISVLLEFDRKTRGVYRGKKEDERKKYLASADFIECYKSEGLSEHGGWEVFLS